VKTRAALILIIPAAFFFAISFAAPLIMVGRLSVYTLEGGREVFVGLRNYARALADPHFLKSFVNVFWFVLMITPVSISMAYWISMLLQHFSHRMQGVGRFIVYVPSLTSGLIMAVLWRWILARGGLLNSFLMHFGMREIGWFGEQWPARISVALVALSGGPGLFVILFSAALLAIPDELREAAKIDGATDGQYRRMVLRPLLMPTILLAVMLTIIGTMQTWEVMYVIFKSGGPRGVCATPVYEIFMTAFMYGRPYLASAKGLLLLVVIGAIVAAQRRVEVWAGQ